MHPAIAASDIEESALATHSGASAGESRRDKDQQTVCTPCIMASGLGFAAILAVVAALSVSLTSSSSSDKSAQLEELAMQLNTASQDQIIADLCDSEFFWRLQRNKVSYFARCEVFVGSLPLPNKCALSQFVEDSVAETLQVNSTQVGSSRMSSSSSMSAARML